MKYKLLVLLTVLSLSGCTSSDAQSEMYDEAYQEGYNAGYANGYDEGVEDGRDSMTAEDFYPSTPEEIAAAEEAFQEYVEDYINENY